MNILNFDATTYQLGSLCKRGHDYCNTGKSLRHKAYRWCLICMETRHQRPKYVRPTFEQSFWTRVDKSSSCWNWTGGTSRDGYGMFCWQLKYRKAHRVAYELEYGFNSIPDGMFVCHKCDNRRCVRFDHLFIGTNDDNMADMSRKGRVKSAKLTPALVLEIREAYSSNPSLECRKQLIEKYGVSMTAINNIISRKTWKYI